VENALVGGKIDKRWEITTFEVVSQGHQNYLSKSDFYPLPPPPPQSLETERTRGLAGQRRCAVRTAAESAGPASATLRTERAWLPQRARVRAAPRSGFPRSPAQGGRAPREGTVTGGVPGVPRARCPEVSGPGKSVPELWASKVNIECHLVCTPETLT
jgi:hypothetical protein